jgi:hypothetical protein
MYFPYFRGKQNELIALRELVENGLLGEKIIPIIEPVTMSPTLRTTIETFLQHDRKIAVILNPSVGNFYDELDSASDYDAQQYVNDIYLKDNVIISHIINIDSKSQIEDLENAGYRVQDMLLICLDRTYLSVYKEVTRLKSPLYTLVPNDLAILNSVRQNPIVIQERFVKQIRNSNYALKTDEFFSDHHIAFTTQNLYGFSDYSVVGKEYVSDGFLPQAVAIHLVYANLDDELFVRHYVSDSNDDTKNQALKKYEALSKMMKDISIFKDTLGLRKLIDYYTKQEDPGLGALKKYAIMHHLETISYLF